MRTNGVQSGVWHGAFRGRDERLRRLAERIEAVQGSAKAARDETTRVCLGLVDGSSLGSASDLRLARGAVHEWIGPVLDPVPDGEAPRGGSRPGWLERAGWVPPMCVLIHAARRALGEGAAVWIGCRPHGRALVRGGLGEPFDLSLLERSVFVDAPDVGPRLWAIDLALRCPGVGVVVADGRGLDLAATRRLQLAAEAGGSVGLLARPWWELKELSAAATRWVVSPRATGEGRAGWRVQLLRCKGVRPSSEAPRDVEWDRAQGAICVSAVAARGPGREAFAAGGARRSA